jgi:hypothetical protein
VLSYEFTRTLPANLHLRHRQQHSRLAILSKCNKLPLASKLFWLLFSLRIANTFSLEVPSIELAAIDNNIRLHLNVFAG